MKQIKKRLWMLLLCLVFLFSVPVMAKDSAEKKENGTVAQQEEHGVAGKNTAAPSEELGKLYRLAGKSKAAVASDSYYLAEVLPKANAVVTKGQRLYIKFYARDTWKYYYTKPIVAIFNSRSEIVYSNFDLDIVSTSGRDVYSGYLSWNTRTAAPGKYQLYIVNAPCYSNGTLLDDWGDFDCPCILTNFTLKAGTTAHQHTYGAWRTVKAPTVFAAGKRERTCTSCGQKQTQTIAKLKPTIKLSATQKTLAKSKSYTLTITKLAKGDSVKSVTSSNKAILAIKKVKANQYRITAKKKGTATAVVVLKSGKKATCKITVK